MAIEACMRRWNSCLPGSVAAIRAEALRRQAASLNISIESLATADAVAEVEAHVAQSNAAQNAPPRQQPDPPPSRTLVLCCVNTNAPRNSDER